MNQQALANVNEYETSLDEIRKLIEQRPDEVIGRHIDAIRKMIDTSRNKRVELEADHKMRLNDIAAKSSKDLNNLEEVIHKLEAQLEDYRKLQIRLIENQTKQIQSENERFVSLDGSQRKIIASQEAMLTTLLG